MKKILFLLPSLALGGTEKEAVFMVNRLSKMGYDVTVLTIEPADTLRGELDPSVKYLYKPPQDHLGAHIPYIRHKLYDDGVPKRPRTPAQLYRYYVGSKRYDVEIAFFHGRPVEIISGSTNPSSLKIAWRHNDFGDAEIRYLTEHPQVADQYRRFDRVVFVSNRPREVFDSFFGGTVPTQTIYNYISYDDIRQKSLCEPSVKVAVKGFHIVLVARLMDSQKGHMALIRAAGRLIAEGYDISLAVIGGGSELDMTREYVESRRLGDRITVTGGIVNPYPLIRQADLLVCSSYSEAFGLTLLEAMTLEVPVLSTDCSGPAEILDNGKYGMIVPKGEEGLYNGVKRLYDDPSLLLRYKQAGAERPAFFDEDKMIKQVADLIEGA